MMQAKKPDQDLLRGTTAALQQAFNGHTADDGQHVGVKAADGDFAALLAQLNDPPEPYRSQSQ